MERVSANRFCSDMDVVEVQRENWATDPFKLVEKDGYFYGRGTSDMKNSDAMMVTTLIRLRKEGFRPSRDIIVALTADEESGTSNGVDWLVNHHRDLIDASPRSIPMAIQSSPIRARHCATRCTEQKRSTRITC